MLTHDNPDPDAIAAAAAMRLLINKVVGIPAAIVYSGFLTRPENRQMVSLLHLRVHNIADVDLRRFRAYVLVDTQPSAGNNRLPAGQTPTGVVDHHRLRRASLACPFRIVDKECGATSTLAYELLKAASIKPPSNIATALFFGIKTDTLDLGREAAQRDIDAYKELFNLANHRTLSGITHPRLPEEYYQVVHRAVHSALIYGNCIHADLGDVPTPEYVSVVADYVAALDGLRWAVSTGVYKQNLYFSLRTLTARKDAGRILRRAIGKHGFAGGHQKMAGGLLLLADLPPDQRPVLTEKVISSLLSSLSANTSAARPLLSPPQ